MKKIVALGLVLLLALSLMACDGNSDSGSKESVETSPTSSGSASTDNQADTPPNDIVDPEIKDVRVIKPSELISKEDADRILERITFDDKNQIDEFVTGESIAIDMGKPSHFMSLYQGEAYDSSYRTDWGYFLEVNLYQNALLDEDEPLVDWDYLRNGGVSYYFDELAEHITEDRTIDEVIGVDGVGERAFFSRSLKYEIDLWKIHTYYDDYMITVSLHSKIYNDERSGEEEVEWKKDKCVETANWMLERLKTIIE